MRLLPAFWSKNKTFFLVILPILTFNACFRTLMPVNAEDRATEEQQPVPSQAERMMKALSAAYPDRISPAEFRTSGEDGSGDWAFSIEGTWFYYAEGRILPEELRSHATDYRPLGFFNNYPAELPPWESTAEQRLTRTRNYEESRARQAQLDRQSPPERPAGRQAARPSYYFFETLWNMSNREESRSQQAQVAFLGHTVTVHSDISPIVARIENIILNEAKTNPAVRQWINSLGLVEGWNWRSVASSGNRSNHSYGIAIDLLPGNLRGMATYWLWSSQQTPLWWDIPYTERYHPPEEVIRAFESFGFMWGGKWGNYDTMHFEYRPEVFIISGLSMGNFNP